MSNLNIGLIGAGRIGQVHASTIAYRVNTAQLTAVTDPIATSAQSVAAKFRIPKIAADYKEIIADKSIDAVMVCTPTDTHAEIIIAAAQAGKHIFCEKPIALDLKQTDAAIAAVEKAGVTLQMGFQRRFDANFARLKQAVSAGEIGELRMVHSTSRDPGPPPVSYIKVSGGIFLDMSIHDWDMLRFVTGSEVTEVYAQGGVMVDPAIGEAGDIDTHVTLLRFASGVIGTVDNCRQAAYGYDQRFEAFGSKGAVAAENNYPNNVSFSTGEHVQRDLPHNFFMTRYIEAYAAEVVAFVDAVVTGKQPIVTGRDARQALLIALAAKQSYLEKRPVTL